MFVYYVALSVAMSTLLSLSVWLMLLSLARATDGDFDVVDALFAAIVRIDEVDLDGLKDVSGLVGALGRVVFSCLSGFALDVFLVKLEELVEFPHDVFETSMLFLLLAGAEREAKWNEVFEGVPEVIALLSHVVLLIRRHTCCIIDIALRRVGQSLVSLVDCDELLLRVLFLVHVWMVFLDRHQECSLNFIGCGVLGNSQLLCNHQHTCQQTAPDILLTYCKEIYRAPSSQTLKMT
jgi:hypothetical protein